jgi:hypothetical protein
MLTGVVVPDRLSGTDVTHTDPVDVLAALRAHWAPVFSKKDTNPTPQRAQLKFCPKLDPTTPMPIPDLAAVERFLKKAKPSAPGPDGLPYAAWLAAGEGAWSALIELWQWTTFGRPLPDGFNKSLAVFPGKGKTEGDENGITRKSRDARPISFMSADSKVLAAITDRGISRVAQAVVTPLQCGFIKHRPIIDNVVDLDGFAAFPYRRATLSLVIKPLGRRPCPGEVSQVPALLLFDYEATLSSRSQEWLHQVLEALNVPRGFRLFGPETYCNVTAWGRGSRGLLKLFDILVGVLQGSPLSGSLFVLATNPILPQLSPSAGDTETVLRACTDDLGTALPELILLAKLAPTMELFPQCYRLGLEGDQVQDRPCVAVVRSPCSSYHSVVGETHSSLEKLQDLP